MLSNLKASVAGGRPVRVGLVEIGAHRRGDEVQELPQDAVLIQARHRGKRALDARPDRRLGCLPRVQIETAGRVEPHMEQLQELARQPGMARHRVGEVAQPERRPQLAQIGGVGPERGGLAPVGAGGNDQPVEPVVVGLALVHGEEGVFQPLAVPGDVDRRAVGGLQHHVVQRDVAHPVRETRGDVIGALVDRREAQVLHHRHALRESDRRAETVDGSMNAVGWRIRLPIEVDGDRTVGSEPFDPLDILERALGRKGLRIARRESGTVLGLQALGTLAEARDGVGEPVVPGAHDLADALLEVGRGHLGRRPFVAPDDELHAHQRPLGEVGVERRNAPLIGLGEQGADALAHVGVVAIAGDEDEQRHEPVEAIDAREHPHARSGLEIQYPFRPFLQLVRTDLEQLVAREGIENIEQRLAVMAGRRIPGPLDHPRHLVAQNRDLDGWADVGRGGEEADEADLASRRAVAVVSLDAEVIHVGAPVHAAAHVGLGDDERGRRKEEPPHLRRHGNELCAAPQHLHRGVAQHAEPLTGARHQIAGVRVARQLVFARAEEGEIAVLPATSGRRWTSDKRSAGTPGRPLFELGDRRAKGFHHRRPVRDRHPHLVENARDGIDEVAARGVAERLGVDGDVAFLLPVSPARVAWPDDLLQAPRLVALRLEDRMEEKAHVEATRLQLAQHRVRPGTACHR